MSRIRRIGWFVVGAVLIVTACTGGGSRSPSPAGSSQVSLPSLQPTASAARTVPTSRTVPGSRSSSARTPPRTPTRAPHGFTTVMGPAGDIFVKLGPPRLTGYRAGRVVLYGVGFLIQVRPSRHPSTLSTTTIGLRGARGAGFAARPGYGPVLAAHDVPPAAHFDRIRRAVCGNTPVLTAVFGLHAESGCLVFSVPRADTTRDVIVAQAGPGGGSPIVSVWRGLVRTTAAPVLRPAVLWDARGSGDVTRPVPARLRPGWVRLCWSPHMGVSVQSGPDFYALGGDRTYGDQYSAHGGCARVVLRARLASWPMTYAPWHVLVYDY